MFKKKVMKQIENIFYTNLNDNLTQYIAEIKEKETINEYTIFIIVFYLGNYDYIKYWKSNDCIISGIDYTNNIISSNGKCMYINNNNNVKIDDFKQLCDEYDLLETHIKFTYDNGYCILSDEFRFYFQATIIEFNDNIFTTNEFIEEIITNYPEFAKYNYSQIKSAIH